MLTAPRVALLLCTMALLLPAACTRYGAVPLPISQDTLRVTSTARNFGIIASPGLKLTDVVLRSDKPDPLAGKSVLVISGGGPDGAYAAGYIIGWKQNPSVPMPQFDIVTGVSTGAILSTFAFLGRPQDELALHAYTNITDRDLLKLNEILSLLFNESFYQAAPLRSLLDEYITEETVWRVAEAHGRGRRLYVGTTNLDSGEFTIWNMGAIAGDETVPITQRVDLYRDIIQASASIPGIFPPVMLRIWSPDGVYEQMHVDGGCRRQMFVPGDEACEASARSQATGEPRAIYVLRNSRKSLVAITTVRRHINILARAASVAINESSQYDYLKISNLKPKCFYATFIPEDFVSEPAGGMFDKIYMTQLFEVGSKHGRESYWAVRPKED